jgi:hypothetical protein
MDGYKQEIVELVGKLTPTIPLEIRLDKKQQETEKKKQYCVGGKIGIRPQ